ncbi:Jag family protein [Gordonia sp. NPDC003504]
MTAETATQGEHDVNAEAVSQEAVAEGTVAEEAAGADSDGADSDGAAQGADADETDVDDAATDANAEDAEAEDAEAEDAEDDDESEEDGDGLFEEGEIAGDYLEQLLDVLDFDGDIDLDVDGDRAIVSIDGGDDLTKLVGRKGEVLDALQELTRLAVQQVTGDRSRLMLDIARWRSDRRDRLARLGTEVAERVRAEGDREALDPMTPFERKIVHDAVAAVDGVISESEGVEPKRRVVVIKVD